MLVRVDSRFVTALACAVLFLVIGASPDSVGAQVAAPLEPDMNLPTILPLPYDSFPFELNQADTPCPVEAGQDPYAVVDAFFEAEVARGGFPGAAIAIALDGDVVHERGFGLKHHELGGEVDAQTQFRFGSVLKMMTAAGVMRLVDAGQVDLDAPVTRYIPEFELAKPGAADDITVWNLITHSTGLPDSYLGMELDGNKTAEALTVWAGSQGSVKQHAPPGSFWNYSNPNFSLAGLVAERASGITYNEYMVSEVWSRTDMTSTVLLPAEVLARGNYTHGHSRDPSTGEIAVTYAPDDYDNWVIAPAGLGFTTAGDLVRWASLLISGGGELVSSESAAEIQAEQISQDTIPGLGYGYGVMLESFGDVVLRHHGGNINGWGAYVLWIPEHNFAVATLNNADGNLTGSLVCAIDAVLGLPFPEQEDYSTDPTTWTPYVGDYHVIDNLFKRSGLTDLDEFAAQVTLSESELRLTLPEIDDPVAPTAVFSRTLTQAALDIFLMDLDLDGDLDGTWSLTFIDDPEIEGQSKWFRNRYFVGTRVVPEPDRTILYLPALLSD